MGPNNITILVTIQQDGNGYTWHYDGPPGVDPTTGAVTVSEEGPVQIVYQLSDASTGTYELVYANLSLNHCITAQVTQVTYGGSTITINDANNGGLTGTRAFGFRLIARPINSVSIPIVSPDPEVHNDPVPNC